MLEKKNSCLTLLLPLSFFCVWKPPLVKSVDRHFSYLVVTFSLVMLWYKVWTVFTYTWLILLNQNSWKAPALPGNEKILLSKSKQHFLQCDDQVFYPAASPIPPSMHWNSRGTATSCTEQCSSQLPQLAPTPKQVVNFLSWLWGQDSMSIRP